MMKLKTNKTFIKRHKKIKIKRIRIRTEVEMSITKKTIMKF